ncbi:MAG: phosphate ABC transporter permease PstA [Rhizobiaceae bacterium]
MTDIASKSDPRLKSRHASEKRFKAYGIIAILVSLGFLALMVTTILVQGIPAFSKNYIGLTIVFDEEVIDPDGVRDPAKLGSANYTKLARSALRELFPDVKKRKDRRKLNGILSSDVGYELRNMVLADLSLIGKTKQVWLSASDEAELYFKRQISTELPEDQRKLDDTQIGWLDTLTQAGVVDTRFNTPFLTSGDSREPELAGIMGAVLGSFFTLLVCFVLSFPIGTLAAIYLEEYAPKSRLNRLIEVNINNLAAVPSIVFGLLGLAILLNTFGLPRSTPLVGGMVLALMTLPTIIIASRASLRAVPPSIREAALGVGASKTQTTFHHVAPLALPGMLTGAIIGMAQALGETAPLLMIGMVAFIVDLPGGVTDAATALPVQIFLWADSPERGSVEKTSAAIIVLLIFLVIMNLAAILLRRKLETRW